MKITRNQIRKLLLQEFWGKAKWEKALEAMEAQDNIETVGDLMNLLQLVKNAKTDEQGAQALQDLGVGMIIDLIPAGGSITSIADLLTGTYNMPDEKRTGTGLDYLDVDDEVAAIVDDPVENKFLADLIDRFEGIPPETSLEKLKMTDELAKYLKKEFDARTVVGFAEGRTMKVSKRQLRRIIKEERAQLLREAPAREDIERAVRGAIARFTSGAAGQTQWRMASNDIYAMASGEFISGVSDTYYLGWTPEDFEAVIAGVEGGPIAEQHKVGGDMPRDFFNPGQAALEITESGVTEAQVSEHWPNVLYRGQDVMDLMYDDRTMRMAEDSIEDLTGEDFEGQEVYLGWVPDADVFIMGFDVWGNAGMEAGIVTLDPRGRAISADVVGSGMYPSGRRIIRKQYPNILELRLD